MIDTSPNKIKTEENIFYEHKDKPFTWKDIKHLVLQDDDEIRLEFVEGGRAGDEEWDSHFLGIVMRRVIETDKQFKQRQQQIEDDKRRIKQRRKENYERLRREFESGEEKVEELEFLNNIGRPLTSSYLKHKQFVREEFTDHDGDKTITWIKNGIIIYQHDDSFSYATYIKGDGSFKGGFSIETDKQLDNLYYSLSNKKLTSEKES